VRRSVFFTFSDLFNSSSNSFTFFSFFSSLFFYLSFYAVAACGLAGGMDFPATVAPFILRGVTLYGIDSVMAPLAVRKEAWARLGKDLEIARLDAITREIGLSEAIAVARELLDGKVRGRVVVDVSR